MPEEMQMDTIGKGKGLAIGFFENGNTSFKGLFNEGLRKSGNLVICTLMLWRLSWCHPSRIRSVNRPSRNHSLQRYDLQ